MSFIEVLSESELWIGEMRSVRIGRERVLLLRTADGVRAYADRCPHLGIPLSRGTLDENKLSCAGHHFEFDARTGSGINPKGEKLEAFPVECRGGKILVSIPSAQEVE